jgi:hypothetical protein
VPHVGGVVSAQQVHVRLAASAILGVKNGNVTNASTLAVTKNVAVDGEVLPTPVLAVSGFTPPLDLGATNQGTAGTAASYTLTGSNLLGQATVTAPAGCEVSVGVTPGSYLSVQNIPAGSGSINVTIWVRLIGTAAGNITWPMRLPVMRSVSAVP